MDKLCLCLSVILMRLRLAPVALSLCETNRRCRGGWLPSRDKTRERGAGNQSPKRENWVNVLA
jgi:hypothetical protein